MYKYKLELKSNSKFYDICFSIEADTLSKVWHKNGVAKAEDWEGIGFGGRRLNIVLVGGRLQRKKDNLIIIKISISIIKISISIINV